jgi:hypothetical protein
MQNTGKQTFESENQHPDSPLFSALKAQAARQHGKRSRSVHRQGGAARFSILGHSGRYRQGAVRPKPDEIYSLPVLRRRTVPLEAYGVSNSEAERFIELFLSTWGTLEFAARRALLRIWRSRRRQFVEYPRIILASRGWFETRLCKGVRGTVFGFWQPDTGFCFAADLLAKPDAYVEAVIVHELIHDILASFKHFRTMDQETLENECDDLAFNLGFSRIR